MTNEQRREMLELAAKAAGLTIDYSHKGLGFDVSGNAVLDWFNGTKWNPLDDDGDALRLAVRLNLHLRPLSFLCPDAHEIVVGVADWDGLSEKANGDPYAATRLAITRAAAEIGRQMQSAEGARETDR